MRSRLVLPLVVWLALPATVAACATRSTDDRAAQVPYPADSPHDRTNVLGPGEISRAKGATTALDAIKLLRPMFLLRDATPGPSTELDILVFVNSTHVGGLEVLGTIPVSAVYEIRYVSRINAPSHVRRSVRGTVIQVVTRKRPIPRITIERSRQPTLPKLNWGSDDDSI